MKDFNIYSLTTEVNGDGWYIKEPFSIGSILLPDDMSSEKVIQLLTEQEYLTKQTSVEVEFCHGVMIYLYTTDGFPFLELQLINNTFHVCTFYTACCDEYSDFGWEPLGEISIPPNADNNTITNLLVENKYLPKDIPVIIRHLHKNWIRILTKENKRPILELHGDGQG